MPAPNHAPAARRPRRRADSFADPRTRRREIIDLIAVGLARIAAGRPAPCGEQEESGGGGLELAEHAALTLVARGPTGERTVGKASKAGEQHG